MDLTDQELTQRLAERDKPRRRLAHTAAGPCRYAEFYAGRTCPWCEAEQRRLALAAASASPKQPD